jgi:uncharacterized protein (DUF433 family)
MVLPDFLTETKGEIFLAGHRIELAHVVSAYREGDTAELIASRYPTLPLSLVHRVIAFYLDNQGEVDSYVARFVVDAEALRSQGGHVDLSLLRQRLAKGQTPVVAPVN